jgi:hypothetical protein
MNIGIIGSGNMGASMGKRCYSAFRRILPNCRRSLPAGMLSVQLAYGVGLGPNIAMKCSGDDTVAANASNESWT